MKPLFLALGALGFASAASASGGEELHYTFTPSSNAASLQRGARNFINYCSGCHSMKHLRYSRLGRDLGIGEEAVRTNLMFTTDKIGDHIISAMPEAAEAWFGQRPPDLTVETRYRGADWVYNYLMTFYVDPARPAGVNNLTLPNASMPHVLWELQGWQTKAGEQEHDAAATAGPGSAGGHGAAEGGKPAHGKHGPGLTLAIPGKLSPDEYKRFVADTVSFMAYAAEPGRAHRLRVGAIVLLYLVVLTVLAYLMKHEWWKDVH